MKHYFRVFIFLGLLVPLLLGACTFPTTTTSILDGEIYLPANNAVVVLGSPTTIYGYGASTRWPVTQLLYYDNGMGLGAAADFATYPPDPPAISDVEGDIQWTPTQVGWNYLQMQIIAGGHAAITAPVRVCVVDFTTDPGWYGTGTPSWSYGYEGPCPIPDRDASAVPGPVTMSASATPDHLVYDAGWPSAPTCPGLPLSSVLFQVIVNDPPEDVAFVAVQYSISSWTHTQSLILTQTGSLAPSTRLFSGTTEALPRGTDLTVTWTGIAYGRDGSTLLTDGPHTIPADPCVPVPLSAPFTPPAATLTATPASARDCPPGTFFAEQTHRCIPVQILPTKPGHGGGCSQYTNPSSCTSNGCSWDKPSSTCH
jgi:hypothetical protein